MLSSLFRINTEPSKGVIDILKKTTLGSNGGLYQHLNTEARVLDLDNPLFLTLERNDKVLGNVTFSEEVAIGTYDILLFNQYFSQPESISLGQVEKVKLRMS